MLYLSVVVPICNERDNLSPLTGQILKTLTGQVPSFEIVYVDDGSTDGSGPLLDQLARDYPEVRAFHFDRNYGQTAAFDAGFRRAAGELIVTLDGDLQYDAHDILKLLPLAQQYDLVCGWRRDRHDTLVKRLALFEGMHRFFPALARMHGFTVTETPVAHFPRAHGQSKYGIGNRVFKSLRDLVAVRWMQRRCLTYRYRA